MRFIAVAACVVTTTLIGSGAAAARGVSPYLPLNLSPEIERQIEQVLLLAGRPINKRPIAAATVLDALPDACKADRILCKRVRKYLDAYMQKYAVTHASAEVAVARDSTKTLPNRRGLGADSEWAVSAQGLFQINDYALVQLGGVADADNTSADGSWLSVGNEYAQLDVGWRSHWWSPMTDSSMMVSTQAPTMPGISLSNYTPISRLGLQYELYAARMSHVDDIAYQGGTTSGEPTIAGMLISIEPAPGWSLSVSRLLQFGGGARQESFTDFLHAFFQPTRYDNVSDSTTEEQFGNQVAAITSRFVFPGRHPFSVYFEYAGEDGSRGEGWRLGNASLSAGIDIAQLWDRFDLTYEFSDWQNAWYVNSVYPEGTSNEGHVIGHWGADDRVLKDAVGAQSHSLRVGWTPAFGGIFEFRYRTLANEDYSHMGYEREHDLGVRYSRAYGQWVVGGELEVGRDVFGDDFGRLAAFLRFAPGASEFTGGSMLGDEEDYPADRRTEIFVDGGINISQLKYNPSDKGATPMLDVSTTGPHAGMGVRRRMSQSVDLGVRAEFDTVDGSSMISVRAIDYRYRVGEKLAFTAFAGATRYERGTAAYGYYGGLGVQWREIFSGFDLNLDARATDKVARDAVLPTDPASVWGDVIYQIYSANLYVSYKFH
jgi:hypothetical protein